MAKDQIGLMVVSKLNTPTTSRDRSSKYDIFCHAPPFICKKRQKYSVVYGCE